MCDASCEQNAIYLVETGEPVIKRRVRIASNSQNDLRVYLQESVVGSMGLHRETLLVDDCQRDPLTHHSSRARRYDRQARDGGRPTRACH